MHNTYDDEFPLLRLAGLYAANIRGDGNCLFNALSDQLYGAQDEHHVIRARVIDYMRENADYYKMFIECHAGGGVRRNPKRKNAGGYSNFNASMPTQEEIDRVFESHLDQMAKGGTWGDNMEIVAFSSAFGVDVKIYQRDNAFMVRAASEDQVRPVCHIAYHAWEHYSSIRNLDGPHDGMPNIQAKDVSPQELQQTQARLQQQVPVIDAQKMKTVKASLPYYVDDEVIARVLKECHGNINNAVDKLVEVDDERSTSSQQSSLDLDGDSSDENAHTPSKKQDRRLSRATKSALKAQQGIKQKIALKLEYGDSLDSLLKASTPPPLSPQKRGSTALESDDEDDREDEDVFVDPLKDGDTSSGSEYAMPVDQPAPTVTGIKLRLSAKPKVEPQPAAESRPQDVAVSSQKRASARDVKLLKKAAQKSAAKERKQATYAAKKTLRTGSATPAPSTSHPTMTSGIRTLYI